MSTDPCHLADLADRLVHANLFGRIHQKARQLARRFSAPDMLEDFEQELALRMFASLRRYRADRLELERFIVMTLRRHVINLIREQQARWRIRFHPLPETESAGDVGDDEPRATPTTACFADRDPFADMDRQFDIQEVLARLDPNLRSFAELLMTMPIDSARRQLGISRRQAMRCLARLRAVFESAR